MLALTIKLTTQQEQEMKIEHLLGKLATTPLGLFLVAPVTMEHLQIGNPVKQLTTSKSYGSRLLSCLNPCTTTRRLQRRYPLHSLRVSYRAVISSPSLVCPRKGCIAIRFASLCSLLAARPGLKLRKIYSSFQSMSPNAPSYFSLLDTPLKGLHNHIEHESNEDIP